MPLRTPLSPVHLCPLLFGLLCSHLVWSGPCDAAEPIFRVVPLNAEAEYAACAVFDVNNDGTFDIFSGGFWYEGPDMQRHVVRDVELIRGRYDDYSNLPLDVDGDGWTDVISCNYRSESLYWVRNPGPNGGEWTWHVIDTPGAMETGRLVDIDGDQRLDVLPNGSEWAAWWQCLPAVTPQWTRHELPPALAGHGIGAGDINGDGRVDLVSRHGWCEQLGDEPGEQGQAASGRWQMREEFRLHPDASIPILVHDVDQDGDQDLIWGRGHRIGLYWLEQKNVDGARHWQQHTIDTTWSQAHSLLLADINGDGANELIAGKRFLGHDGRDIGEYDPLGIFWYRFNPTTRSFQRGTVSTHPRAAFGLDPKAADVDADGDVDIVVADRSGLYVCENLNGAERSNPPADPMDRLPDHQNLLVWENADGEQQAIDDLGQWAKRRQKILAGMQEVMGELPDCSMRVPLDVEIHSETDMGTYKRQRISYTAEPADRVPAYLLIPHHLGERAPAMLCLHQTTNIGKDEPAGLGGLENLHYAHELAERGFVCLVPDYPSFGEYPFDFAAVAQRYASGSMKAIWNNLRAIDLLESLPQVDPDRIGCIGHSLGGHNTLFTAAFDQRIAAAVTSCGFTAFHQYYGGNLAGWTSDRYMPRIRQVYADDPDRMPFDFYEVLAAIAPRHVFVSAPLHDDNFDVEGVRKIEAEAQRVYKLHNAAERMRYVYPDSEHDFPTTERHGAYEFLQNALKP